MSDRRDKGDSAYYDPEDDVLGPLPTSSGRGRVNPWDRVGTGLIIAGVLAWAIVWIITGIWWTIFMIIPTILLIALVLVLLERRAGSFNN
jgi:hypothetical protein